LQIVGSEVGFEWDKMQKKGWYRREIGKAKKTEDFVRRKEMEHYVKQTGGGPRLEHLQAVFWI